MEREGNPPEPLAPRGAGEFLLLDQSALALLSYPSGRRRIVKNLRSGKGTTASPAVQIAAATASECAVPGGGGDSVAGQVT